MDEKERNAGGTLTTNLPDLACYMQSVTVGSGQETFGGTYVHVCAEICYGVLRG